MLLMHCNSNLCITLLVVNRFKNIDLISVDTKSGWWHILRFSASVCVVTLYSATRSIIFDCNLAYCDMCHFAIAIDKIKSMYCVLSQIRVLWKLFVFGAVFFGQKIWVVTHSPFFQPQFALLLCISCTWVLFFWTKTGGSDTFYAFS